MVVEQVYTKFSKELYRYILKRVKNDMIAKDVLQDVFLKIIEKSHQLSDQSKFKHWIYRITSNEIINYYRQQKKGPSALPESLHIVDEEDENLAPLEDCLIGFINDMPEHEKLLIQQVEFEGKSQKEVAEILQLPYSSIRSRVQRARQKLKKRLLMCCKQQLAEGGIDSTNLFCDTESCE